MAIEDNLIQSKKPEEQILVIGSFLLGLLKYTKGKLGTEGRDNRLKSWN